MEVQARKFYSQRNMYLCGFTLFLSLILNRTYTMILDVLRSRRRSSATAARTPRAPRASLGSVRLVARARSASSSAIWRLRIRSLRP